MSNNKSGKKGLLKRLFGPKETSGCCNMEIVEEPEANSCCRAAQNQDDTPKDAGTQSEANT